MVKESCIPNTNDMEALKSHESWAGSFIESVRPREATLALPHKYNAHSVTENITKPAVAG